MPHSPAEIAAKETEHFAGFLMLQLAGLAYGEIEVVAQWLSSLIIMGSWTAQDYAQAMAELNARIVELQDVSGQIWPGLVPDGDMSGPKWEILNELEFTDLSNAQMKLTAIETEFGKNYGEIEDAAAWEQRLRAIGRMLYPHLEDREPYRTCITVGQRADRYNNTWLLWDVDESVWYRSEVESYTNVSHGVESEPELREGMTIEISDQLLTPMTPEEVADFLDPSNPG